MASQEQIKHMIAAFDSIHPANVFKRFNETNAGIGAVLRFLHENDAPVTAGQISSALNISTARVAALLKKMTNRELIIKETGVQDARTTLVSLSPKGAKSASCMQEDLYRQVGNLIDRIGSERLCEYIAIAKEIHSVLEEPQFESLDEF